jgi:hypothetical protein
LAAVVTKVNLIPEFIAMKVVTTTTAVAIMAIITTLTMTEAAPVIKVVIT